MRSIFSAYQTLGSRQLVLLKTCLLAAALSGCALSPGLYMGSAAGGANAAAENVALSEALRPHADTLKVTPSDAPPAGALTPITAELIQRSSQQTPAAETLRLRHLFGAARPYTIGSGDLLQIVVWDHPEINLPAASSGEASGYNVSAKGTIQFPYVGNVQLSGLTEEGARSVIARGLARVIRDPQVTVRVQAYRNGRAYINGEVRNPGLLALNDIPLSLPEAIARSGGLLVNADRSRIAITRRGVTTVVNLYRLGQEGIDPGNILLASGDIVHVHNREDAKVYVMGEVYRPSSQPLRDGRLSLSQALGESGGVNPGTGNASQIYVLRSQGGLHPQIFHLDASTPLAYALAEGFELQARDVVFVDPAPLVRWNRVISLLLPSVQGINTVREATGN